MTAKRESTAKETPLKRGNARRGRYTPGAFDLTIKRTPTALGLFAGVPIPEGACVIEYIGHVLEDDEWFDLNSRYLFRISENKTINGSPRWNLARNINHSCSPNCQPEIYRGRLFIRALRAIDAGEELTYDYGPEYFEEFIAPRGCLCASCVPRVPRAAK